MSLHAVAQLAGVSTSTVSRVINDHPNVTASTVASVRRAMQQLSFTPLVRRRALRARAISGARTGTLAFIVFGTSGSQPTPAFEQLLRGVSEQASKLNMSVIFSFVSDPTQVPPRIVERRVDGLLLHGGRPSAEVQSRLQLLPTVWLMANPQRPAWGDQVMPDNSAIGTMAADYLLQRGHRRLAYLGTRASWSLELRSLAFAQATREGGGHADVLETSEQFSADFWQRDGLQSAVSLLVSRLARLQPRPTGLFIAEDRLVPLVDAAIKALGNSDGGSNGNGNHDNGSHGNGAHGLLTDSSIDIVSCNNERSQFGKLQRVPATIDIRAESIGRLGVERLIWRLGNPELPERIRCMVEPVLIDAEGNTQLHHPEPRLRDLHAQHVNAM